MLTSIQIDDLKLPNRVVMAPLTRRRATDDFVPTPVMIEYYRQRASAGLIIAEATNISRQAVGYMNTPGIYTSQQIEAWKKITEAVHLAGGRIFLQLWHTGSISHPDLQEGGRLPVSASAIIPIGEVSTPNGHKKLIVPRPLTTDEIPSIVKDYKKASENAIQAGFDGVEIHGANAYLPDQFLHDGSNKRTDDYGGSVKNRCRFLLDIVDECCKAIGNKRVGLRLSPSGIAKGIFDSDPVALFDYLISELNTYELAYLHLMEPYPPLPEEEKYANYLKEVTPHFRKIYKGILISNVNYNFESANTAIENGSADLIAFGKSFISNPDLVDRFKNNFPLTPWDTSTFYYGGEKGYVDYPGYQNPT